MIIKSLIESCGVLTLADKIHSEMFFFVIPIKKENLYLCYIV